MEHQWQELLAEHGMKVVGSSRNTANIEQIRPGLVETEFAARCFDKAYADNFYSEIKCLQPDDIKDAILYVISAPSHVEVNDVMMRPTQQVF